jgi:hypothetical protein
MLPTYQRMEVFYNEEIMNDADTVEAIAQIKAIEYGYKTKDDAPDSQSAAINILESGVVMGLEEVGIITGGQRTTTDEMAF